MRSATVPEQDSEAGSRQEPGLSRGARIVLTAASCVVAGYVACVLSRLEYDERRTVMWWLHRYVLAPIGWSIRQSGWDRMMAALSYVHWAAAPLAFMLAGWMMKRLTAAGWLTFRRFPLHCCQSCGYDLTGNSSGVCPECGRTIADAAIDPRRSALREGFLVVGILGVLAIATLTVFWISIYPR